MKNFDREMLRDSIVGLQNQIHPGLKPGSAFSGSVSLDQLPNSLNIRELKNMDN